MVSIEKYIEKLLLKHDCVIMPGLGGFVTHSEPSYRDEESGLFYPPTRTIGFNAGLKMNDGLLVQAYMQAFDTNYPEANRMVERATEIVKETLHTEGAYEFEDLGLLELKADNTLLFTPKNEGGIVDPELYGLDAFPSAPYIAPHKETETDETPIVELLNEKETTEPKQYGTHYIIRLNKAVAHYAAAAILAILFYFAFPVPIANQSQKDSHHITAANGAIYGFPIQSLIKQGMQGKSTIISNMPTASQTTNKKATLDATPKGVTVEKTDSIQTKEKKQQAYYTIVLASSIRHDNAEIFVDKLKEQGFSQAHIYQKNKMIRVVYSSYSTKEQARKDLNRLCGSEAFENAWILLID